MKILVNVLYAIIIIGIGIEYGFGAYLGAVFTFFLGMFYTTLIQSNPERR